MMGWGGQLVAPIHTCLSIASRAAEGESLERREPAIRADDVVIGNFDGRLPARLRAGIDGECGETVGVRGVAYRRPDRILPHIDRRPLAGSGGPTDAITRHCGGSKNSSLDGSDVPPPPSTICTAPLVLSMMSIAVDRGIGVSVRSDSQPRIGWQRS
jgi:hypothetical protein